VRSASASLVNVTESRARKLRTLMSVDALVGRVFHEMESLGERHETLAIYLSDNGDLWGEHGIVGKRVPYTESIHVPRAMRWPGHLARGSLESNIATNVDLAPTILDAAGVEPPVPMDGISVLGNWVRTRLFAEHWGRDIVPNWAADSDEGIRLYRMVRRLRPAAALSRVLPHVLGPVAAP
jgi:arylsulfatase A-like enzyme